MPPGSVSLECSRNELFYHVRTDRGIRESYYLIMFRISEMLQKSYQEIHVCDLESLRNTTPGCV